MRLALLTLGMLLIAGVAHASPGTFVAEGRTGDTRAGCAAAGIVVVLHGAEVSPGTWLWTWAGVDRTAHIGCTDAAENSFFGSWDPAQGGCLADLDFAVLMCLEHPRASTLAGSPPLTHYDLTLCGHYCIYGFVEAAFGPQI